MIHRTTTAIEINKHNPKEKRKKKPLFFFYLFVCLSVCLSFSFSVCLVGLFGVEKQKKAMNDKETGKQRIFLDTGTNLIFSGILRQNCLRFG